MKVIAPITCFLGVISTAIAHDWFALAWATIAFIYAILWYRE